MLGIDLRGDGDRRLRTVEFDAAIEGITRREVEGVVQPCSGHSQRGGGEHPLRNVSESEGAAVESPGEDVRE